MQAGNTLLFEYKDKAFHILFTRRFALYLPSHPCIYSNVNELLTVSLKPASPLCIAYSNPCATAYQQLPIKCVKREIGAINVCSIVPSQRSMVIISVTPSNVTLR